MSTSVWMKRSVFAGGVLLLAIAGITPAGAEGKSALSTRLDVRYKRISSNDFFGTGEKGTIQYIPITFGLTF